MTRFRASLLPLSLVAAALATGLTLSACGGDDDDGGDGQSADEYAKSICTAASDWVEALQKESQDLSKDLGANASPAEGKKALQVFLRDSVSATDTFGKDIEAAGVPDADEGDKLADELSSAADEAKGVLKTAEEQANQLPTNDVAAFTREAGELGTTTQRALSEVGDAVENVESDELNKAFDEEQSCKSIGT